MSAYREAALEVRGRLDKVTRSLERYQARVGTLEAERSKLENALEVLMDLSGDSSGSAAPASNGYAKGTTKDAIVRLLRGTPEPLTISEIEQALSSAGRAVPRKTIRGTLSLGKDSLFEQVSRGCWQAKKSRGIPLTGENVSDEPDGEEDDSGALGDVEANDDDLPF